MNPLRTVRLVAVPPLWAGLLTVPTAHLPAAMPRMAARSIKVYEAIDNAPFGASFAASNAAGQTHSYQALYHPQTGVLQVARDGNLLGAWTDTSPLASGGFLSLRTDGSTVQFDDIAVSEVVKYYIIPGGDYIGGQRVAMRKAATLYYLLTDHLGSTNVVTNQSGGIVAQQLYKPWGEPRWSSGTLPTDRKFTGQRSEEANLGSLYDYGARAYSPRLGRFLSADTIVPQPGDPQSLNRYSYTLNNPLRYTDPTGHAWSDDDRIGGTRPPTNCVSILCLPTPTPYPTWTPLFQPRATPAPPVVRAVLPTPYAGPWLGPGAPLTPTPTPDPILAELMAEPGRVNWPDLYHTIMFQGLLTSFPEAVGQKTVIHAAGRSGQLLTSPLVGYAASVGPGLYEHVTHHDPLRVTLTDVVVDTGGFAFSTATGVGGAVLVGFGGVVVNVAVSPLAAAAGEIGGAAVGSVGWDLGIAPRIRGDVYRAWGIVFR